MIKQAFKNVTEYIATFPEEVQGAAAAIKNYCLKSGTCSYESNQMCGAFIFI